MEPEIEEVQDIHPIDEANPITDKTANDELKDIHLKYSPHQSEWYKSLNPMGYPATNLSTSKYFTTQPESRLV